jgi:DNA-binding LacI/PurR family transcriptional regulator
VLLGESRLADKLDHVGIDNVAAVRAAVEHLIERGRTRIAGLGAHDRIPAALLRRQGFEEALRRAGLAPHSIIRTPDWERHTGARGVEELLGSRRPLPDAVFAFNDTLAIGALRALLHAGIEVPSEVAVASIDDVDEAAYTTPSLTSVAPDLDALADASLNLLEAQRLAAGAGQRPRPPRQEWVPFRLMVRESTGG